MRSLKTILILLIVLPVALAAQNKRKPTMTLIGKVSNNWEENLYIKPGEFKIDFKNKYYDESLHKRNNKYVVIVRGDDGEIKFIKLNGRDMNLSKSEYPVELLRAGVSIEDFVYIDKRNAAAAEKMQYKYYLHVGDHKPYGPYDGFSDIFPTGYVCKNKGVYTFMNYEGTFEEILPKHKSKDLYDGLVSVQPMFGSISFDIPSDVKYGKDNIECYWNGNKMKFKTRNEVVYRKTHDGKGYMIYNDSLMDNTLLIVDSICYELDGVVKDIAFKYSQNGSHWMAFCPKNLIVDGVTVCNTAESVKHFAIKNSGEFAYVVEGEGAGDKMYVGSELYASDINMMWLSIDDEERFNYIFRSDFGYFYGVDNDIVDRNKHMEKYYYPKLFDGEQVFIVTSNDEKHTFVYSYDLPYIMIDGVRMDCPSVPHYAVWNEKEGCFMWNTVEDFNLYLYSIKVK